MGNPLVSIIIPVYNREHIVNDTIMSIIDQTYKNWECIVVDDGSTDDTYTKLLRYQKIDTRIKPYKRPNEKIKGANACRNYGLEMSKGAYVVWFDSDDLMHTNYLELQIANLSNSKFNFSICKSHWQTITGKVRDGFRSNQLKSNDPINDYIQFIIFWPINAVCYNMAFIQSNGLKFDETLQQSQEYDFHVKVLLKDSSYTVIDEKLITVIASEESVSYSEKNLHQKTVSSLKVKMRFLKNSKKYQLKIKTKLFILNDMHRVFQQQTMQGHKRTSIYSAFKYLSAHWTDRIIAKKYFFKHVIPILIVAIAYNLFGVGYNFFKKSNTFIYDK